MKLLDVGSENNVWTYANVVILSYAALLYALCGFFTKGKSWWVPIAWFLGAVVLFGFSFDDFFQLHERLRSIGKSLGGGQGLTHFAWVIPGSAFALVSVLLLLPVMFKASKIPRRMIVSATALLFTGALGLEMVSGYVLSQRGHTHAYDVLMHCEELMEAFAAALFLAAGIAQLRILLPRLQHYCEGGVG